MSICGWIGSYVDSDGEVLSAMAARLPAAGAGMRKARTPLGALAVTGREPSKHLTKNASLWLATTGRPRLKDLRKEPVATESFCTAITGLYRRHSELAVQHVAGQFSLALLDLDAQTAILATDRMGAEDLYYQTVNGNLVFASRLAALDAFPGAEASVSAQAIFDYIYHHTIPGPQTVFAGRRRILPGNYISWRKGGVREGAYWQIRYVENEKRSFQGLKQEFTAVLRESVEDATEAAGQVGAFLSGGTDSSTVAGLLAQSSQGPARTYSIGFEESGFDESHYADIAARHFGTEHHRYYVTPDDVTKAIPLIAAGYEQPFGNASAIPAYYCAKLAHDDGIETLLAGDGGDELFGGNARYSTQYLYSLYSDLPSALRRLVLEPVASALPSVGLVQKARRYMANASIPMPARYELYNLVHRLGAENIFTPEFLCTVDQSAPLLEMAHRYGCVSAESLINRMLSLDLKYTLADNDLPKVIRSCELAGVEARFPLLDDRIVEFSARLEPRLKVRGTRLRYFFKEALRDFLPEAIIRKSKHGFGLPFGRWLQTDKHLSDIAHDSLAHLRRRSIVRTTFIDQLTNVHVQTHSDYFGAMVWVLMMLEQWFAARSRDRQIPLPAPCEPGAAETAPA